MKKFLLLNSLVFLLVILSGCASHRESDLRDITTGTVQTPASDIAAIQKITFHSVTRGYSKSIVFTPDSMSVAIISMRGNGPDVKKAMSVKEWSQLTFPLLSIQLSEIPKLESPTNGRQTDAALGSIITIFTSDKKEYAHYFDDVHPNAKLQQLMDAITALEKSKSPD